MLKLMPKCCPFLVKWWKMLKIVQKWWKKFENCAKMLLISGQMVKKWWNVEIYSKMVKCWKMLIPKIKIFIYLLSPMIVQLINNITLLDVHQFPTLITVKPVTFYTFVHFTLRDLYRILWNRTGRANRKQSLYILHLSTFYKKILHKWCKMYAGFTVYSTRTVNPVKFYTFVYFTTV
jgi:hypothetical protein